MEHNTCRENLSAYLDNELPGEQRLSLESHLAVCPRCSRELAQLKEVSAIFKKHALQPAPLSLKDAVFAEKSEKPGFYYWLKPVSAFAAAAVGLLIILALPKTRDPEQAAPAALFQGASYKEETAREVSAGDSAAALESSSLPAPSAAGTGASATGGTGEASPRYAALSASRGSFGQAKFAGAKLSKAAAARSAPSLAGGAASQAIFSAERAQAKRTAPAVVPDIVSDGMRLTASHWREAAGKPGNGGSVRAFSARGGELLWEARVYEYAEDPGLEADVQQVHISAMALNGASLEITDEQGSRYRLDLRTREAEKLSR